MLVAHVQRLGAKPDQPAAMVWKQGSFFEAELQGATVLSVAWGYRDSKSFRSPL